MENFLTAIGLAFDFVGGHNVKADGLQDGDVQAVSGYTVQIMLDEYSDDVEQYHQR